MQKLTATLLATLFLLISATGLRAQQSNDQSMLWRITGNGLTAPSYLFGTMHVKNKQAFHFKDSLYHFIEQAQGFALELHPDSMDQVITAMLKGSIDFDDFRSGNDFSEKDIEKIATKISKDKSFRKKSKKEKMDIIMSQMMEEKEQKDNSMSTFMDAFLYSLALENGKKIFGLEQVKDQVKAFKYLRNGVRMDELAKRIDKINWDASPPIYEYYYRERLDSINNFYTSFFSDSALKGFLYNRNIVMAHQLDSLSQVQTMFAAVGAAHLPGEKGVVALLRQKGYTVEPVFSQKKIFAGDYARKEYEEKWAKNSNDIGGYEYETPKPVTKQADATRGAAEYSLDLVNGMVYMVISGVIKQELRQYGTDTVFAINNKGVLDNTKGFLISKKDIEINGLKGVETLIGTLSSGYSKIFHLFGDNKFYILLVSTEKKADLDSKRVDRFVKSFKVKAPKATEWNLFKDQQAGFAVQFPYAPVVVPTADEEASPQMIQTGYTAFDPFTGTTYSLFYNKAINGHEIMSSSYFFNSYLNNIKDLTGNYKFTEADTLLGGYPARTFEAQSEKGEAIRGLIVRRNNVAYFLTAEFDPGNPANREMDKYFESFILSGFPAQKWSVNKTDSFSAWTPSRFEKMENEFDENALHYISSDPASSAGYHVEIADLGKYFWAEKTDSLLNYWTDRIVNKYSDTILTNTKLDHAGIPAKIVVTRKKDEDISRKYIFYLNGNSMYMAYADRLPAIDQSSEYDQFFTSFLPTKKESSKALFSRTPELLFNDLLSADSAVFAGAFNALSEVVFTKKQLPLILDKILHTYPEHSFTYTTVATKLWQEVDQLAGDDPLLHQQIAKFINDNYVKPGEEVRKQRLRMLSMLAKVKTADSYATIKDLMNNYPVTGEDGYYLISALRDSLALTRSLYPDFLKFAKDTLIGPDVASLTLTLLDSNILSRDMVKAAEPGFIEQAKNQLADVVKLEENDYDYNYKIPFLLSLVAEFKTKETEAILKKYAKVKVLPLRFAAVEAQFKAGFAVAASDIKNFAGRKAYRVNLYEAMKKYNKQTLFPSEHATQTAMAKSYLFSSADEDDYMLEDGADFIFIKKMEIEFKGEMKRFLVFRTKFNHENDEEDAPPGEDYLAVAGPFSMDEKEILLDSETNFSGIHYGEKFDGNKIDKLFKNFIDDILKYYK